MNVLNMFQEEDPKFPVKPVNKTIEAADTEIMPQQTQEPLQPATNKQQVTFTIPPTFTPYIPTNQEQAQQAILGDQQYALQPPVEGIAPEPTREERIARQMEEDIRLGVNPWMKMVQKATPVLDEEKQKRLKLAAAANALGQGLSSLFGGYVGSKGGPILEQKNDFTPAALLEYNQNIKADEANKYRNAIMEANAGMSMYGQTKNDINQQVLQENNLAFHKEEAEKQRKAQLEAAERKYSGNTYEEKRALIELEYENKIKLQAKMGERMAYLQALRQSNALKKADYDLLVKKLFEEYKASIEKITTETTGYENGKETKGKIEKYNISPANPKPTPKAKTEEEILQELGIKPKGKLLNK